MSARQAGFPGAAQPFADVGPSFWWPTTRMTPLAACKPAPSWLPEPEPATISPASVTAWALPWSDACDGGALLKLSAGCRGARCLVQFSPAVLGPRADRRPRVKHILTLVDSLTASRVANMKELRPPSAGRTEIRILFVYDPWRSAVLLVAGDKSGQWDKWYRMAIPRAEQLYEDYLAEREKEMGK
jgi:hypothetical protein